MAAVGEESEFIEIIVFFFPQMQIIDPESKAVRRVKFRIFDGQEDSYLPVGRKFDGSGACLMDKGLIGGKKLADVGSGRNLFLAE